MGVRAPLPAGFFEERGANRGLRAQFEEEDARREGRWTGAAAAAPAAESESGSESESEKGGEEGEGMEGVEMKEGREETAVAGNHPPTFGSLPFRSK